MKRLIARLLRRKARRYFWLIIEEWDGRWYVDCGHYENGFRDSGNLYYPHSSYERAFESAMNMLKDIEEYQKLAEKWRE